MIYLINLARRYTTFYARIVLLLVAVTVIAFTEMLGRLDFVIYDEISTLISYPRDSSVAIVAIDEKSLDILGSWPWSRGVHAELINRLTSIDNQAVAMDIIFSEQHNNDPYGDQLLATAIAAHGNVILPVAPVSTPDSQSLVLTAPHQLFKQYSTLGHTDVELDNDGVVRRAFLYAGINSPTWPALALAMSEPIVNKPLLQFNDKNKYIGQRKSWVRADEILIPYAGEPGSFRQVPYVNVLFDDKELARLKGKKVIVGMTAAGMGTRFATPVSSIKRQPMSGVEWHANVYSALKNNLVIHLLPKLWVVLLSVLWITVILGIIVWTQKNFTVPLLLLAFLTGLSLVYLTLKLHHIWIPPSAALLGTLALYPLWNWQRLNQFIRTFLITKIRSSTALESIEDGVIITDAQDQVMYINNGAARILQTEPYRVYGKALQQILHIHAPHDSTSITPSAKTSTPDLESAYVLECVLKTTQGDKRSVRITRNQLYDEYRVLIGSVIAIADITDTVELAQQVMHQENHDTLTKLPNRSKLLSQFDNMIRSAQGSEKIITVFFIALDNFKKINDAMGHQAGDKLLKLVSRRLFEIARQDDVVARWGGDEFILLTDNLRDENCASETGRQILDIIKQKFRIDGLEVFVSASIGISFYPKNGMNSEVVLERAGTAMYGVKRSGGNRLDYYSPESSVVWTRDRLELEKELRTAIKHDELQVLFQPIINAHTNQIARMEALVRWPHPARGYLSPSEFIPLAENVGLIEQLGENVLKASCIAAYQLLQLGYPVNVSVNVNPRQLLNKNFQQTIINTLHETKLPPQSLILEITENTIINDIKSVANILNKIKELEILIALDDFGTGYSSLTLLRELPIDILKIDKSFVRTLDQNQNDLTIVQAIIGLGINLGLMVIAEGVETAQQAKILIQHQCCYQQGYHFSRPVPYNALLELVSEKNCHMPTPKHCMS